MYLSEFLTIAIAHLVAVASPGPDFAVVLRQSVVNGRRAGLWTSAGVALGILLHVSYCVLGVGLLLSRSPSLSLAVKLIAAVYLVALGFQAIKDSLRYKRSQISTDDGQVQRANKLLMTGFLTNGLNPKATMFFLALFTVVIDVETPVRVQAFYGIYLAVATFCWFAMLSVILGINRVRAWFLKSAHWFERLMGIVLIGLGIQLALTLPPVLS